MKTALDPRHQNRIRRLQALFSAGFGGSSEDECVGDVLPHLTDIDSQIAKHAPEWPVDKISKIDLAILRLSIFELTKERKNPVKVVIDEAVELAKEFGNENSPKFVNGVLGAISKEL